MICVHCSNLYLLFPSLRTFLSQIRSTRFTTPLQVAAQISHAQGGLLKNNHLLRNPSLPTPFYFPA